MQVKILGWSYKGIRGVNNLDISVEAEHGGPYQTSLIMMPNGTGKTTTITLLRAIFDGKAYFWDSQKVRSFKPQGSLNEGMFTVRLLIDDAPFHVSIRLNYAAGIASYMTTRTGQRGGLNNGHELPTYVKDIFSEEFVKRFVFDGELANHILQSEKDEAEQAIKFLYHINRLDDMRTSFDRIVSEEQNKNEKTKAKTTQGLAQLRSFLTTKETQRNKILRRVDELKKLKEELSKRIKEINAQLKTNRNKDNALQRMIDDVDKQRLTNAAQLKEQTLKLMDDLRNPNMISEAIATRLTSLSNKMQHLKLPRTMSRQFFEESADQPSCICGREIGTDEKEVILENSKDYLAEDQIGVINAIKSSVKNRIYDNSATKSIDLVQDGIIQKYKLANDWERLEQQRKDTANEEEQALITEAEQKTKNYNEIESELDLLTTKDRNKLEYVSEDNNLTLVEQKLEEFRQRYLEATTTVRLSQSSMKIKDYLFRIESLALKKLKNKIKDETNRKLSQIIKSEVIHVEHIDRHLVLRGKDGTSVGQSLAIAYSYLGSLFNASSHELPFIVDSPAGALDLGVRREVSKILPNLFEQLIIFITSGEREGFTEHFSTMKNTQFLTINKKRNMDAECVEGYETFMKFQEVDA